MQIAGPETYRWKLRGGEAAKVHALLWRQAATWLMERARPRRQLRVSRPWTVPGDRVPVAVAVHGARFEPLAEAVHLEGSAGTGAVLLPVPFQTGRFHGAVSARSGRHPLRIAANPPTTGARWIVAKPHSSAENTAVALARLVSRSGGHILNPGQSVPEILLAEGIPAQKTRRSARDIAWLPAMLLLAATIEWGMRRRWGCEG